MFLLKKLFCFVACFMMVKWKVKWSISKKSIVFQGSRWGPFFSRGPNFFQGVSNCLFPIETHLICDFPEGVRTPCPPTGSAIGAALTASLVRLQYIISFGLGKR